MRMNIIGILCSILGRSFDELCVRIAHCNQTLTHNRKTVIFIPVFYNSVATLVVEMLCTCFTGNSEAV